jgi:hypothetical protein
LLSDEKGEDHFASKCTEKLLANLTKMRKENTKITKIRKEKVEITTNTTEIQGIMSDYLENLYSNKLENLEKWTNFYVYMTIQN